MRIQDDSGSGMGEAREMEGQRKRRRPAAGSLRSTSYDVARQAGVSQSTVSRAFDPDAPITDELRRKVRDVARELGWQPNAIARSLQRRNTDLVGLITTDLDTPWRSMQLASLIPALQMAALRPLVFHTTDESDVDQLVAELASYQGRAVVIGAGAISSRLAEMFADQGVLVIIINRWMETRGVLSLVCDNRAGGGMVADHLAEQGCRRILLLHNWRSRAGTDRVRGFTERALQHDLESEVVEVPGLTRSAGREVAQQLTRRLGGFDGVFCVNDALALGVIDHAYAHGSFRIGHDFALVGFDDVTEASSAACSLTTVRQPLAETAAAITHWLGQWKSTGVSVGAADSQRFRPQLVIRRSSAAPAVQCVVQGKEER